MPETIDKSKVSISRIQGLQTELDNKQETLVSGTNIKTINGNSLLGNGNIDIQGGGGSYTAGDGIDITNNAISVTSPTIVSNTNQDITGIKTFIGEKKIHFKQSAATDKLGFTLFDNSDGELAAFEYRPNTISGNALMNINTSQSGTSWLGFRYWANINIVAPKPSNGTYYIPVNITNGTTTVTANNAGTVNVSTLIPTVNNSTITITQGGVTKGSFTLNQTSGDTIALDAGGGGGSYTAGDGIDITNDVISVDGTETTELSIDTTPTQNSSNLITSGGVYSVLGDIETLINAL